MIIAGIILKNTSAPAFLQQNHEIMINVIVSNHTNNITPILMCFLGDSVVKERKRRGPCRKYRQHFQLYMCIATVINNDTTNKVNNIDHVNGNRQFKKKRATTTVNNHTFIDIDIDKNILYFFIYDFIVQIIGNPF